MTMITRRNSGFRKFLCVVTILTFVLTQNSWALPPIADPGSTTELNPQPQVTLAEVDTKAAAAGQETPPEPSCDTDFLAEDSPLTKVDDVSIPDESLISELETRELERYDIDSALDMMRSEYASAVILDGLDKDGIKKLTQLEYEVGIIVLKGE
ncbi:MAG: hypothetical protein PHE61_07795, partial [Candidatus Omnitrophica bacterium]|nr:hypothetical protein [Candidatus Omnitrophota bacterium]